jgi:hypothetical protein
VVACSDRSKCYPMSKPVRICNVDFTRILPVLSLHPSAKCVDVKTRVAQGNQTGDIGYTIFSWRRSVRQVPAASRLSVQVTFRLSSSSDMCAGSVCCEENRYNRGGGGREHGDPTAQHRPKNQAMLKGAYICRRQETESATNDRCRGGLSFCARLM